MTYRVKEMFLSFQGEGFHSGRRAVFVRFAGCNLWSGREEDRAKAICQFCDTDFVGGERMTADEIANRVAELWGKMPGRFVVLTGGEPTLQVGEHLPRLLRERGFLVAMETNGTREAPSWVEWVCVSPKARSRVVQRSGHELKVVWPQPLDLDELERWDFAHRFIQPMDGHEGSLEESLKVVMDRPAWRLSLQTHKLAGVQ